MTATGNSTLNGVTITGNSLDIPNTKTVTVVGTLTNQGTIRLNSLGNNTTLQLNGDVILTGGGTITMSDFIQNRITGLAGTERLTNEDNLIQGAGQIGVNNMALTNRGTVTANQSSSLTIDPNGAGVTNPGTMQSDNGGTLIFSTGSIQNFEGATNGLIQSDASNLTVQAATVTGGTVAVVGAGEISLNAGTITGGTVNNSTTGIIRTTAGTSTLGGVVRIIPTGLALPTTLRAPSRPAAGVPWR